MNNLLSNLPHLIIATIVIAAVVILTATGHVSGPTGLAVIAGAGGVSLGVGAAAIPTPTAPAAPTAAPAVTPPAAPTVNG